MKRRALLLAGASVLILAGLSAPLVIRTPPGAEFPSFPAEDRRLLAEKIHNYPLPGRLSYSSYFYLRLREPWATALPKIERDLAAQGFRRRYANAHMGSWTRSETSVLAVGDYANGRMDPPTSVSVSRRATVPEALAAWFRQLR